MPTPSNETPTTIILNVEDYRSIDINQLVEYTFYINGQEFKKLPLDANVREPDVAKSKPYKDMRATLEDHPEDFFENNLGISVIAKDVEEIGNKKFKITFPSGTGILNGGHTQQAILDSQSEPNISKAIVKLVIRVKNYDPARIAQIASAQNSSTAVKEYSLAEKKGLFAEIKGKMDPNKEKHISWWENKEVAAGKGMEPTDLIAILNVFNFELYSSSYSNSKKQPTQSSNGKATVFKNWENEENINSYKKIYPLINDILDLYELIKLKFYDGSGMARLSIISDTKGKAKELIFGTETPTYEISKQMLYPLLASYRANIYYDAANKQIGWFEDNKKLFNKYNKELCGKLMTTFKANHNEVNHLAKDPTIWENLFVTLKGHIDTSKVFKKYDI